MKNKQIIDKDSGHVVTRFFRSEFLLIFVFLLGLAVFGLTRALALPAERYRYSGNACGSSDAECFKSSAEAGAYRAYKGILNRQPDSGGFSFWSGRLQNGQSSITDVAASLIGSSEWRSQYSAISNQQFVAQTYQFLLARNPSSTDSNYWTNELNSGRKSRAQVAASFINSTEGANTQHAAFMNYFRPPAPPPPPTPTPTPTPTPAPKPSPQPSTPSSGARAPSQSQPSASGLQISDFAISELNYRSALLTWKTNKPSSTKANYSINKDDLYLEQGNEELVTDHTLRLEGEDVRAGRKYYVRITSDDGAGPVTIDGEFSTKLIAIIVKVTGQDQKVVPEALVTVNEIEYKTNVDGEATLELPEGEVTIFAEKDNLSQQILADIEVPTDENTQRITLSLSETSEVEAAAATATAKKKGSPWWLTVILVLLIGGGAFAGFTFWRRRRQQKQPDTYYDPLEAENYAAPPMPSTDLLPEPAAEPETTTMTADTQLPDLPPAPEPDYERLQNPELPHHSTLPEMVGRYGPPITPPLDTALDASSNQVTPAGQEVPHHTSLKQMVHTPESDPSLEIKTPTVNDLPASPLETLDSKTTQQNTAGDEPPTEEDGSLKITH